MAPGTRGRGSASRWRLPGLPGLQAVRWRQPEASSRSWEGVPAAGRKAGGVGVEGIVVLGRSWKGRRALLEDRDDAVRVRGWEGTRRETSTCANAPPRRERGTWNLRRVTWFWGGGRGVLCGRGPRVGSAGEGPSAPGTGACGNCPQVRLGEGGACGRTRCELPPASPQFRSFPSAGRGASSVFSRHYWATEKNPRSTDCTLMLSSPPHTFTCPFTFLK